MIFSDDTEVGLTCKVCGHQNLRWDRIKLHGTVGLHLVGESGKAHDCVTTTGRVIVRKARPKRSGPTSTCVRCGKPFIPSNHSKPQRFCSRKCAAWSRWKVVAEAS